VYRNANDFSMLILYPYYLAIAIDDV
jgi:hypothetical protein